MKSGTNRLRSCFYFALVNLLFLPLSFAPPANPEKYNQVQGGLVAIPDGSIIEGSINHGGIQPDYQINLEDPDIQRVLRYARRAGESSDTLWEKIDKLNWYMRRYVLPKRDYDEPEYRNLLKKFSKKKRDIPLAEYVSCKAGVCREHALLSHFMLKEAGIDNLHVYAQIRRSSQSNKFDITEDHAFTVVTVGKDNWVIDPYYWGFNGFLLKDLLSTKGITPKSRTAPIAIPGPGFRRIIGINSFPKVWIPISAGTVNQMVIGKNGKLVFGCSTLLGRIIRE